MIVGSVPSRRELNKERTRESISAAVALLARQRPLTDITAEQIAEQAGVSRRTFFNYYAGVDAVLAEAIRAPMSDVAQAFLARPDTEDPLTAIIASLAEQLPVELIRWCVVLGPPQDQHSEIHAQVWHRHTDWLSGVLRQRLGADVAPAFVDGLAGSIMSIFAATTRTWLERSRGLAETDSLQLFATLLVAGLRHARDGWRHPHEPHLST